MSTIFTRMMSKKEVDRYNKMLMVNDEQKDYICIMCREYVSKDESYSNRGKNLLCISCFDTMCNILNLKGGRLEMLNIIHTPYQIPSRAELNSILLRLKEISNILDVSGNNYPTTDDSPVSYKTIYTNYLKAYTSINKLIKYISEDFDLKYEQNMNKKYIDTGYQE